MAGRSGKRPLSALKAPAGDYEVGYGKPPAQTRFQPGQSGNPKGRPRGSKNRQPLVGLEQLKRIVLQEAYRKIPVSEAGRIIKMPAIEAIVRTMAIKGAKGDHRSQRLFAEMLWEIEGAQQKEHLDMLMTAVGYKELAQQEITRREQRGLPPPLILPHPDDVLIDWETGAVKVAAPVTREQFEAWEELWEMRTQITGALRALEQRLCSARSSRQKSTIRQALALMENKARPIDELLPRESYERWSARYPADGELVEIKVPR